LANGRTQSFPVIAVPRGDELGELGPMKRRRGHDSTGIRTKRAPGWTETKIIWFDGCP
jgi:hypothetical protein